MKDLVFDIIASVLNNSPERSYKRLNPSLRSILGDCISADLPFQQNTFQRIHNELRGGWWFGDGGGSNIGEHYYTQACGCNHASAIQSFEAFSGRPGVLWEEDAQTPERLHVGSRFTWKGHYMTVTSMRRDSLVACTYKESGNRISGLKVGATVGEYNKPFVISESAKDGRAYMLRVIPSTETGHDRNVAKRLTIPYSEIVKFRHTEKARLKAVIDEIRKCDPSKDAKRLTQRIQEEHFRHFALEQITKAFAKRKDWQASETRVTAWRDGANGAWLDVREVFLRVNGDQVQCSNGNSVSVASVKRVLPIVLARRNKPGAVDLPLDSYKLDCIQAGGVKVGCTSVPWSEVDYISTKIMAP